MAVNHPPGHRTLKPMPASAEPPEPAPTSADDDAHTRSGRAFVLVCVALCVALVAVMVFVSPRLLEATRAQAPDPTPVEIASGEVDGMPWTATAIEPEDDRPCAELVVDGTRALRVCGDQRGPSNVRALDGLAFGDTVIVAAIVDPRSTEVAIEHATGTTRAEVVYADFGFPLGFAVAAVPGPVAQLAPYGEDGGRRGHADCRLSGADHDPDRHVVPPIVVGTGDALGGGCLLTD